MNPGQEVTVKCTYAQLYDPNGKAPIFSLQDWVVTAYPFGTIISTDEKFAKVLLNDEATQYLLDNSKGRIRVIATEDRTVLVKLVAIKAVEPAAEPSEEETKPKDKSKLIWLLGAALLAML